VSVTSFEGNWRHALTPPAGPRRAVALGLRCGAEALVGPRPRAPRGGGRGASHHAPSSPAPPHRRDSDTPMMPLLFDVLFPIIHVARFGLDVGRPAADTTIQQHQPPRAGAHNPSGSLILAPRLRKVSSALGVNILGHVDIRVTHVVPHNLRPCAFAQHRAGMLVRKLRKYLYRSNRPAPNL
jgi:hypothetical protein